MIVFAGLIGSVLGPQCNSTDLSRRHDSSMVHWPIFWLDTVPRRSPPQHTCVEATHTYALGLSILLAVPVGKEGLLPAAKILVTSPKDFQESVLLEPKGNCEQMRAFQSVP